MISKMDPHVIHYSKLSFYWPVSTFLKPDLNPFTFSCIPSHIGCRCHISDCGVVPPFLSGRKNHKCLIQFVREDKFMYACKWQKSPLPALKLQDNPFGCSQLNYHQLGRGETIQHTVHHQAGYFQTSWSTNHPYCFVHPGLPSGYCDQVVPEKHSET